jgi:hypothetical protein
MSEAADRLWREARDAFEPHRLRPIDRDAQMALDRIAAKCLRISFNERNCTIREEVLDLDGLRELIVYHENASPGQDHEPIIVLSFKGARYVIDGNKRVNAWRATGRPQSRRAIIIEPTEAGYRDWFMRARLGEGPVSAARNAR